MWTCELWESQTHTGLSSLGECGRGWGTEREGSVSLGGGELALASGPGTLAALVATSVCC